MLSHRLNGLFNDQINRELESAYLYLAMAQYFHAEGLEGMASWMAKQAEEETEHAMKFVEHINSRGGRVELQQIGKPTKEWSSPLAVFEAAYEHEKLITNHIHELLKAARTDNDPAAEVFLHWFVDEQVEEEDSTRKVVDVLRRIGDSPNGLFMVDQQLAKRN